MIAMMLMAAILAATPMPTPEGDTMPNATVIDFENDDRRWYEVHDGVMGGISDGGLLRTAEGSGLFSGDLSLENNGGFASVRTDLPDRNYADRDGLEIRVRGDGRTYQLRLRTDDRFDGVAYRATFETRADAWTVHRIPFAEFRPTFRGRVLTDRPPLDPSRLRQLSLMIADGRAGPYRLEIEAIRTWNAADED